jgi:hypothetical protein
VFVFCGAREDGREVEASQFAGGDTGEGWDIAAGIGVSAKACLGRVSKVSNGLAEGAVAASGVHEDSIGGTSDADGREE